MTSYSFTTWLILSPSSEASSGFTGPSSATVCSMGTTWTFFQWSLRLSRSRNVGRLGQLVQRYLGMSQPLYHCEQQDSFREIVTEPDPSGSMMSGRFFSRVFLVMSSAPR